MRLHNLVTAITRIVGIEEALFLCGLLLVGVGLWPAFGLATLAVVGAVILWVVVPSRAPLIERERAPERRR